MTSGRGEEGAIGRVLTDRSPFGPEATENTSAAVRAALFEDDNRIFSEGLQRRPHVIVGRRGSGKTAFLDQLKHQPRTIAVDLPTAKLVNQFQPLIDHGENWTSSPEVFAEHWHSVLMVGVAATFANPATTPCTDDPPALHTLREFVSGFASVEHNPLRVVASFVRELLSDAAEDPTILSSPDEFSRHGVSVGQAVALMGRYFDERDLRLTILLDSTEKDELIDDERRPAFGGLLKLLGNQSVSDSLDLCMAFPAEQWGQIRASSTNQTKDLANPLMLHWQSKELWTLAARRLVMYLREHHPDSIRDLAPEFQRHSRITVQSYDEIVELLDGSRGGSAGRHVFASVFPGTVTGRRGTVEPTLQYVMRHTQLLPRQLLQLLNSIWFSNQTKGGVPWRISGDAITQAINDAESGIVSEICAAYKSQYPDVHEALKRLVPNMTSYFRSGELQRAHQRYVRGRVSIPAANDAPWRFREMLCEIGVIGRVFKQSGHYVEAQFAYTMTGDLDVGENDLLAFHPLVSGAIGTMVPSEPLLPVIPRGTATSSDDDRLVS